eukprot:TRINITY_DN11280_c0_g1_i1.p1 TRINITY_DN11280_c0_g1~~TRINITY_DN11280_c0_g1_i1.p1  ORF type:complete len:607 (-),score=163.36 TRINITY_DN11280_c0_g1_i1:918-2738(-)
MDLSHSDEMQPLDSYKQDIAIQLSGLSGYNVRDIISTLEQPKKVTQGDIVLSLPKLNKFKKLQESSTDLSQQWAAKFKPTPFILEAVSEGHQLNFRIEKSVMLKQLIQKVFQQQSDYGGSNIGAGQTVIVEFSSPNIAKPFHAGHLRSTIIGNFLNNLHKVMGFKTITINYLGDWGKQYGLLAVGFSKYGSEEKLIESPIKHLFEVYVAINKDKNEDPSIDARARAYFKEMECGNTEALALWKKFRDLSIVEYKKIYARININFDEYSGESMFGKELGEEMKILESKHLLVTNMGAKIVNLEEQKLGIALIEKQDGTSIYMSRDIAAAHHRKKKYNFAKMLYVVAIPQTLHFMQLFAILKKMGYDWVSECQHVSYGMVNMQIDQHEEGKNDADGCAGSSAKQTTKGMSTRNGNVVFLTDILDAAKNAMLEVMKANEAKFAEIENPEVVADIIGLSAVVIQDFTARRIKDYAFNWKKMTSFEGDTGPYLQYTHTRLCSIERKAKMAGVLASPDCDVSLLKENEALDVLTWVGKYPSIVLQTYQTLEACTVVTYLMGLAHTVSSALEKIRVVGVEPKLAESRLAVYSCARIVLGNGLRLLGLIPLEHM